VALVGDEEALVGDEEALVGDKEALVGEKKALVGEKVALVGAKRRLLARKRRLLARKRRLLARKRLAKKEAFVRRVCEVVGTRRALTVKGNYCERGYWRESGIRRERCGRGVGRERGTCVREGEAGGACVRDGEAVGENEVGRKRRSPSRGEHCGQRSWEEKEAGPREWASAGEKRGGCVRRGGW
jgi:hypothetical protein